MENGIFGEADYEAIRQHVGEDIKLDLASFILGFAQVAGVPAGTQALLKIGTAVISTDGRYYSVPFDQAFPNACMMVVVCNGDMTACQSVVGTGLIHPTAFDAAWANPIRAGVGRLNYIAVGF